MDKNENTPLWVFLAFSSIDNRQAALWLVWGCIAFTVYCVPWPALFPSLEWVKAVFLIDGWSWFAMMVAMTAWYWLSLRWADNHSLWEGVK